MLSPARFERMNGHTPTVSFDQVTGAHHAVCVCTCDMASAGTILDSFSLRSESAALEELLERVYREHARIVFEKQTWQCAECGRVVPLQCDHIRARAHGRDDRVANLRPLCQPCHERRHGRKA